MAKGRVTVTEKDRGYKKFLESMKELSRSPYVKVGFPEENPELHQTKAGEKVGIGGQLTVAQVATFQEFGTEHIPPRSFLRLSVSQSRADINSFIAKTASPMILLGGISRALGLIGLYVQNIVQKKIQSGDAKWKALAPETIAAKGSSRPLIDTGQMVQSVRYVVVPDGEK